MIVRMKRTVVWFAILLTDSLWWTNLQQEAEHSPAGAVMLPNGGQIHPILDKQPTAGVSMINNGNIKERSALQKTDQKQKKVWKK